MRIDFRDLRADFVTAQQGKASPHSIDARFEPSRLQYDYLTLRTLADDLRALMARVGAAPAGATALDLGSHRSPYRSLIEGYGFVLKTLDLTRDDGADYAGTAERTLLPDASFDLVICTQVLEHTSRPWDAVTEICRILKPGGHALLSAPHVWFFHPHPQDHWRFTQEGLVRLCVHGGLQPEELRAQGGTVLSAAQIANFLLYGAIGKWATPIFVAMNTLAPWADRLIPNPLFCHNFACLARRP
jgi:SAM-dependent methyltransferase